MGFYMLSHEEKFILMRDLIDSGITNPLDIFEIIKQLEKNYLMIANPVTGVQYQYLCDQRLYDIDYIVLTSNHGFSAQ